MVVVCNVVVLEMLGCEREERGSAGFNVEKKTWTRVDVQVTNVGMSVCLEVYCWEDVVFPQRWMSRAERETEKKERRLQEK